MRTGTIYFYFIECDGRIKIGFSRNPDARVRELSTGAPAKLNFLGRVNGAISLETALHRHLRNYRVSGEWFRDCDPVREAMQQALNGKSFGDRQFRYPELVAALKRIASPLSFGDSVKDVIKRASDRSGLPHWRTFNIYYGKARRVEVSEAILIREALLASINRDMARPLVGRRGCV